jgi:hypothetical protein
MFVNSDMRNHSGIRISYTFFFKDRQLCNDTYTYVVIPGLVLVVDDCSSQAPRWVDASAGDGDGGNVNHENSESNWERGQHLQGIESSL